MDRPLDEAILAGNRRAAARLMRLIDDGSSAAHQYLTSLLPHCGQSYILGVTGNPGSGKSTLVSQLIARYRQVGDTVACIAVDPTSPFSGGAILGDRVRMQEHADDDGVFIRSVATRGHMGGLSRSTPAMVQTFDAMGFDVIIIETVGVGQDEVEIVRLADTSLVLLVPGMGDDIQADKAGLMEIADIFVLNKSDLQGSRQLKRRIQTMLTIHGASGDDDTPHPPIHCTEAAQGSGIDELFETLVDFRTRCERDVDPHQRIAKRFAHLIRAIARTELEYYFNQRTESPDFASLVDEVISGHIDPYSAAHQLMDRLAE